MAKPKKLLERFTERTDGTPGSKWDVSPDEATLPIADPLEYVDHRLRLIVDASLLNGSVQNATLACRALCDVHALGEMTREGQMRTTNKTVNIVLSDAKTELKKRLAEEKVPN
jgi:hypothetical protein